MTASLGRVLLVNRFSDAASSSHHCCRSRKIDESLVVCLCVRRLPCLFHRLSFLLRRVRGLKFPLIPLGSPIVLEFKFQSLLGLRCHFLGDIDSALTPTLALRMPPYSCNAQSRALIIPFSSELQGPRPFQTCLYLIAGGILDILGAVCWSQTLRKLSVSGWCPTKLQKAYSSPH